MWLLEARLLLTQISKGPKALSEEFARCHSQLTDGVSPFLLFQAFQRIDYASTALTFETYVADFLASVASNPSLEGFGLFVVGRAFPLAPVPRETLADTLWQESRFSAVDLYLGLIDVLRRALDACPDDVDPHVRTELVALSTKIADPSLRTIALLISPESQIHAQPHELLLLQAADAYTAGNYERTLAMCDDILLRRPDCFDAVELWAKATINGGKLDTFKTPPVDKATLCDNTKAALLIALTPEYSARPEAVQALKKLSYTLLSLPSGRQMAATCAAIAGDASQRQVSILLAVHASALTPRTSNAVSDNGEAQQLLHSIEHCYGPGPTTSLFSAYRSGSPVPTSSPSTIAPAQQLRYEARSLYRQGLISDALSVYDRLEAAVPPWSTFSDDALCGRFDCLLRMHRFADCAELTAQAVLTNRPLPRAAQMRDLAGAYARDAVGEQRASVAWPIFFSIRAHSDPGAKEVHEVFAAIDTYLVAQGVDRPSRLPQHSIPSPELRALFLKVAVAQEVLELSISFDTVDELDAERIAIFQQLVPLDPDNSEEYSTEIKKLVRRSSLRRDLQSIDLGKVHVDLDGIRRTLDPAVRVRMDYFAAVARGDITGLERTTYRPSAEAVGDETAVQLEPVGALGPFLFKPIFDAIHRRYTSSNEFGLDSYLSLRIRHGVLVGHIRSVFEQARLVTKRDAKGQYQPNHAWDTGLTAHGLPTDGPRELLAQFSARVDAILEEAKSQRIQIRSDTHPAGLFDFTFLEGELEAVYQRCVTCTTTEEMIDVLFGAMNDRTDRTLVSVRTYVTSELDRSLSEALSTLQTSLLQAYPDVRLTDLFAAIADCRTRIHSELTAVAGWFALRTGVAHADFELPQLVAAVEEVVRKVNPSSALELRTAINVPFLIRGGCFDHFVDMFWLLLDNVGKHAEGAPKITDVDARIEDDDLSLAVRNRVDGTDVELMRGKVELLQRRLQPGDLPAEVRREGGSGFFKLKKILEHDLGLGDSFGCRLECEADVADGTSGTFGVRLRVPMKKVCLCES